MCESKNLGDSKNFVASVIREHLVSKRHDTLDGISGILFTLDEKLPQDTLRRIVETNGTIRIYTVPNLSAKGLASTGIFIPDGTPYC